MSKLSEHISLEEAIKSQTAIRHGISNIPEGDQIRNMMEVARRIFEPIRAWVSAEVGEDQPIYVSSFFRCEELNRRIGGSKTSQHIKGEAIDIDMDVYGGKTNAEVFEWVKNNLVFDQLIWEFGDDQNPAWVHISLKRIATNRHQVIKLK